MYTQEYENVKIEVDSENGLIKVYIPKDSEIPFIFQEESAGKFANLLLNAATHLRFVGNKGMTEKGDYKFVRDTTPENYDKHIGTLTVIDSEGFERQFVAYEPGWLTVSTPIVEKKVV